MNISLRHTLLSLLCLPLVLSGCATMSEGTTASGPLSVTETVTTPDEALAALKAGNARFVSGDTMGHDYAAQVEATGGGQKPFAIVLGCVDSRVPPEVVFDQGIGDIFSARVAGNFENTDILGSMEFATAAAGSKLIMVLGHTACGAVKGATDGVELGNLTDLLGELAPAVEAVGEDAGERSSKNLAFVDRAAEINVQKTIDDILERSAVIKDLVDKGQVKIAGGMYDVASGEVVFYD